MITKQSDGVYSISGTIDVQAAELVTEFIALEDTEDMTLDFSALSSADSVLLAVILNLSRKAASRKGDLKLKNIPDKLKTLARTYGIEELLKNHYAQ